jgi:N-acetyl-alpha-D-muramate 1-phosphate uridylyltransferase
MAATVKTAMILAAGRGERMRPLTDRVPKPLLEAGGKALVEWQIEQLAEAGFRRFVINHAHLGSLIEQRLGDGSRWGVRILYSGEREALETAGGIRYAMPLIAANAFAAVNSDVHTDYDYRRLASCVAAMQSDPRVQAHLVLVDNPPHHPRGDFYLEGGMPLPNGTHKLTFAGIGAYRAELFDPVTPGSRHPLAPLLTSAIAAGRASAEHHKGMWCDVGTPQRLQQLDARLSERTP